MGLHGLGFWLRRFNVVLYSITFHVCGTYIVIEVHNYNWIQIQIQSNCNLVQCTKVNSEQSLICSVNSIIAKDIKTCLPITIFHELFLSQIEMYIFIKISYHQHKFETICWIQIITQYCLDIFIYVTVWRHFVYEN